MYLERYATEEAARLAARLWSIENHATSYVIHSPAVDAPGKPFCSTSNGFTRHWERLLAIFEPPEA